MPASKPSWMASSSTWPDRTNSSRSRPRASDRPVASSIGWSDSHRVVLVHPIPIERWLVIVDADGVGRAPAAVAEARLALDLFDELVRPPGLMADPAFRIELALTREEEIRGPIPDGARYRYPREWWRLDRRLIDVIETIRIDTPLDLLRLLPADLPEPFTTADIVALTGRSKRLAMRAAYCLERSGAVSRGSRIGRHVAYHRVVAAASVRPDPAREARVR